jgi:hypothetical protein
MADAGEGIRARQICGRVRKGARIGDNRERRKKNDERADHCFDIGKCQ